MVCSWLSSRSHAVVQAWSAPSCSPCVIQTSSAAQPRPAAAHARRSTCRHGPAGFLCRPLLLFPHLEHFLQQRSDGVKPPLVWGVQQLAVATGDGLLCRGAERESVKKEGQQGIGVAAARRRRQRRRLSGALTAGPGDARTRSRSCRWHHTRQEPAQRSRLWPPAWRTPAPSRLRYPAHDLAPVCCSRSPSCPQGL